MLAASAPSSAQSTAETMRDVYGALADMLPVALDQQAFESREGIERMGGALDVLEHAASDLASHGGEASAEFTGLARSFESNIALLRQSLDMERYYEFNYLVLDLTHNCASCHARLPAGSGPAFAADLADRLEGEFYTPLDRALVEIATRQFDDAMTTLEAIIHDPATEPLDLELDGVLFDYLNVGITVLNDTGRVSAALERLRGRDDLPWYMFRYLGLWMEHLEVLAAELEAAPSPVRASELFGQALTLSPVPSSQVRVVYDLVVSTMLRRLIEDGGLAGADLAEAYWMLGVISIRTVNPRPGVPHTELLLDAAIRANPGSDIARDSYALLEEYNRISFAGIPTAELPDAVLDRDELRRLSGIEER